MHYPSGDLNLLNKDFAGWKAGRKLLSREGGVNNRTSLQTDIERIRALLTQRYMKSTGGKRGETRVAPDGPRRPVSDHSRRTGGKTENSIQWLELRYTKSQIDQAH